MKRLRLDAAARAELREAVLFYNGRQPGLGKDCLAEASRVFQLIRERPDAGRHVEDKIRRCRLDRFPYYIIFEGKTDHIAILAFMHQRREPGYWRNRS